MSETKFTSGPLRIEPSRDPHFDQRGDFAIVDSNNKIIGEAFEIVGIGHKRPAKENALLFAAAPELYEALAKARQYVMGRCDQLREGEAYQFCRNELDEINRILQRARGEGENGNE